MGNTFAIIPAAGSGVRFGASTKKQFLTLRGKTLLEHTLGAFLNANLFTKIIVCLPADELKALSAQTFDPRIVLTQGGATRAESVYKGFIQAGATQDDVVLVHDAVRPLVSTDLIKKVAEATLAKGAVIPALPVSDTIKEVNEEKVGKTIDRRLLQAVQTPQGFKASVLNAVYAKKPNLNTLATDEAFLVEEAGFPVYVVAGEKRNIKVTTPDDLAQAEQMMGTNLKIGQGYDVHRLVEGRKLIIGGVTIPYEKGLLGHSDADVLLHAIGDALLGAAGLGDLGEHFSDQDKQYKDIDSKILLADIVKKVASQGYKPANVDATVVAQAPKLKEYKNQMRKNIASLLNLSEDAVNIKATTEEGMGFTGTGEGMSASAVVLVTTL
ncbi:2-C-methyl-D-erythritol 4-phosphate cytidylyltransferase [bacterium]|nr:2-C-methyl-D-erythritol 4-phosphate cytidylyltransferase [bacterium]